MTRMIVSLLLALVITLAVGPWMIRELRKLKFGQTIYDLMSEEHKKKQGTPTMGGLMMALAVTVSAILCHPATFGWFWDVTIGLLFISLGSMLVGFLDDYIKVAKKRSLGLTGWQKIAGQVLVSALFALWCYYNPTIGSKVFVPFVNIEWDLGLFYVPLVTIAIIFIVNSANLQDGLDGICATVSSVGACGWAFVALAMAVAAGSGIADSTLYHVCVFAMAVLGATRAFLRFNRYPAQVFMGDTGSMFLGGAMVGMALITRQPFMLLLINFTMVFSSVSVILQRYYFKLTRKIYGEGRRIFKMSPIHHHFEKCGMSETQIVTMYATVTAVLSLICVLSLFH